MKGTGSSSQASRLLRRRTKSGERFFKRWRVCPRPSRKFFCSMCAGWPTGWTEQRPSGCRGARRRRSGCTDGPVTPRCRRAWSYAANHPRVVSLPCCTCPACVGGASLCHLALATAGAIRQEARQARESVYVRFSVTLAELQRPPLPFRWKLKPAAARTALVRSPSLPLR
jgi:hypothetical protein